LTVKTSFIPLALVTVGCGLVGCNSQSAVVAPVSAPVVQRTASHEKAEHRPATGEKPKAPDVPSPFAGDKGAKLVESLLKPSDETLAAETRKERAQRSLPAAAFLEQPQLPLPPSSDPVARLPAKQTGQPVRPRALAEGPPLDRYRADPTPPRRQEFATAGPIALPSPDLHQPVPLPILGRPHPDRAPLTDPTADVSVAAALAAPVPIRTNPAPFVRLNRPEPFEHAQTARLRTPLEEEPVPPVAIPRTPPK